MQDQLRRLPKVQTLLEGDAAAGLIARHGREDVANAIRAKLDIARAKIMAAGGASISVISEQSLFDEIATDLNAAKAPTLKRAINATGVIIHTNLGRARLAPEAIEAMQSVAAHYSSLELALDNGKRGTRHAHVEDLICQLTGAEAAMVVNNCAAAILTCLSALASGQQVIASRGELVEIGGSFRMPDVITQSGAVLKEVGTTNKTHLRDYAEAIGDDTALLLKSHTSNYAIVGFTSAPDRQELAQLAHETGTFLLEDLGSGVLIDLSKYGLREDPVVRDVLAAGVDLVTFSGDKLLGGPQAGIIAGRRALIDRIKKHPMARAVRIDKLSLAALRATLALYKSPHEPIARIPVLQMLAEPIEHIRDRANQLCTAIQKETSLRAVQIASTARAGAGSLPQQDLPSAAIALSREDTSVDALAEQFRKAETPIIGRITQDQFLLDMRAVAAEEVAMIIAAARAISPK
ncbi:MAG: L-seryl-tRNA(Sec) selenium transferase [Hyphomonadaceae bacterium]|nr:L-seryl-tRNA(Sec) selenium transferase [Hyphomonadaceae bacterium]